MGSKPATICRFCKEPGELIKGAHRECKNKDSMMRIRKTKGIPPERWKSELDRQESCNTCKLHPREGQSLDCQGCRKKRQKAIKAKHTEVWKKKRRAAAREAFKSMECLCGCGKTFDGRDHRRKYATAQCRPVPERREPAPVHRQKPKQAPALPPQWTTKEQRKADPTEPKDWKVVTPETIQVTRIPMRNWSRWEEHGAD